MPWTLSEELGPADHTQEPWEELLARAEAGDAEAQFLAGGRLLGGKFGAPLDLEAAQRWFDRLVEVDHPMGTLLAGLSRGAFLTGRKPEPREFWRLVLRAVELGVPDGGEWLSNVIEPGSVNVANLPFACARLFSAYSKDPVVLECLRPFQERAAAGEPLPVVMCEVVNFYRAKIGGKMDVEKVRAALEELGGSRQAAVAANLLASVYGSVAQLPPQIRLLVLQQRPPVLQLADCEDMVREMYGEEKEATYLRNVVRVARETGYGKAWTALVNRLVSVRNAAAGVRRALYNVLDEAAMVGSGHVAFKTEAEMGMVKEYLPQELARVAIMQAQVKVRALIDAEEESEEYEQLVQLALSSGLVSKDSLRRDKKRAVRSRDDPKYRFFRGDAEADGFEVTSYGIFPVEDWGEGGV